MTNIEDSLYTANTRVTQMGVNTVSTAVVAEDETSLGGGGQKRMVAFSFSGGESKLKEAHKKPASEHISMTNHIKFKKEPIYF